MLILRPTQNLAKRMSIKLSAESSGESTTTLGDWYALEMVLNRKQYIICTCEKARLSVVIAAAPYATFPERLPPALLQVLRLVGIPREQIEAEIAEMKTFQIAKTTNRSVVGTMKEFRMALEWEGGPSQATPEAMLAMSLHLADHICMQLPERAPVDAARNLFNLPKKPHLRLV